MMAQSIEKDHQVLTSTMNHISGLFSGSASASAESPTKKRYRHFKEITEMIEMLEREKQRKEDKGQSTAETDADLASLYQERRQLRADRSMALSPAANLGAALDDAA